MKINITAFLETSDHDGYCSDSECSYSKKVVNENIDIDIKLLYFPITDENKNQFIKFLPEPYINSEGSYFCYNSTKSTYYGINKHDYRYTIIDFKILDKNYSESVSESRIG